MSTLTDVQWIFVVLATLYLIETLAWIRAGTVAFPLCFGRIRNPRTFGTVTRNDRGRLVLAGISPLDTVFLTQPVPLSVGTFGVVSFVADSPLGGEPSEMSGRFYSWEAVKNVRVQDARLLIDDDHLCQLRTREVAQGFRDRLRKIADGFLDDREAMIKDCSDRAFDVEAAAERLAHWQRETRWLGRLSAVLAFWIVPVGIAGSMDSWPVERNLRSLAWYLGIGLLLWWIAALAGYLAHRRLHGKARGARFKLLASSVLSPVVPLRARDQIARELFDLMHPLTFIAAWTEFHRAADAVDDLSIANREFLPWCEAIVRDLMYPKWPTAPQSLSPETHAILAEHRQRMIVHAQQLVHRIGFDWEALLQQPAPEDPDALSYCPRCLEEYTAARATCAGCGQRPTEPFRF